MTKLPKLDFVLAGVGGQGTILLGDLISDAGIETGYDVKKSDALGMSQRGGNVVSYVRLAEKVYSPIPKKGDIDFVVSLEILEAARWADHVRPGGVAIVNKHKIPPLSVSNGLENYPSTEMVESLLRRRTDRVFLVDATAVAAELKNPRTLNIVILGFMSPMLSIDVSLWRTLVAKRVPPRFVDLNLEAFDRGRALAISALGETVK